MAETEKNTKSGDSEVVALVNDEKIVRSELDSYAKQVATIHNLPVPDKATEERKKFERQILDQIINNILLFQDAESQGITISEEEINSQHSTIVARLGGEEKLNQTLEKAGITAEHLRKDLARQNVIEKYFDFVKEKNEIKATEEEIKAFYDEQVVPQKPDLKLEAIEPQIRRRIEQQKLDYPISEILGNLRKGAEIKILL